MILPHTLGGQVSDQGSEGWGHLPCTLGLAVQVPPGVELEQQLYPDYKPNSKTGILRKYIEDPILLHLTVMFLWPTDFTALSLFLQNRDNKRTHVYRHETSIYLWLQQFP